MLYGYGGRIARVDLEAGQVRVEPVERAELFEAIGGRGLNSLRLYEELPRGADPLGPENLLVIGVGPLTGSLLTASAYLTISGKSPLTGILGDSAAGGFFGPEIKQAGFDQIVLSGCAPQPCYLFVADGRAELRPADHLWGRDIWEATAAIRRELGDPEVQVAAIGPAGENLVKYATVACNHSRTFGRTGMGCLFGAKRLKAIAVRGRGRVTIADPPRFLELCREFDRRILTHPEYARRQAMGSTLLMRALNGIGILPTRHFQEGVCDYVEKISGERLAAEYKVKHKSCFNCSIHCSRYYLAPGAESEGPEFEALCSYTSRIGNDDLAFALRMIAFLNRMGVDALSSGETIGWAMECRQRGLLSPADLGGLDLRWGNREAIEALLGLIVRREGIGDLFAEGTRQLARHFGRGTEAYALHVKGLDVICGDPRGIKAFGLTYAIASRGADHLRAEPFFELTGRYDEAEKRWGIREIADRLADTGKAVLVEHTERQALLTDCLTVCKNIGLSMDILDFELGAELLQAGTGLAFTPDRLNAALRGVIDRDRLMNIDFGVDASADTLPRRFTDEPLPQGASAGQVVPIRRMVGEYYAAKGWDENGRPRERIPRLRRRRGKEGAGGA
jgi:aldehyde:ferredoxin oxidoreductase